MKDSVSYQVFKVFNVFLMLVIVFVTLYPFLNIIAQSFSSETNIIAGNVNLIPQGFNIDTYRVVMSDSMFWINYRNTVVYTVVGTFISLVLSTMLAYPLAKKRLRGRNFLIMFVVFTMFF